MLYQWLFLIYKNQLIIGGKNMNILNLKFFNDDVILYEYQPEGKGEKGIISYNRKNCDCRVEKRMISGIMREWHNPKLSI